MYNHFVLTYSIVLFVVIFSVIQFVRPPCFYLRDGSLREFGVGYRNKTIFPVWLMSIVLGLLCYLAVSYYAHRRVFYRLF